MQLTEIIIETLKSDIREEQEKRKSKKKTTMVERWSLSWSLSLLVESDREDTR